MLEGRLHSSSLRGLSKKPPLGFPLFGPKVQCSKVQCSKVQCVQLTGQAAVSERNDKWKVEKEGLPVRFLCVVKKEEKLEELDEEGVEDPEEGEKSPLGMVVVKEVEDESLNIGGDVDDWKNDVEENKLDKLYYLHLESSLVRREQLQ